MTLKASSSAARASSTCPRSSTTAPTCRAQFGVKIDGILGFPLFRNAVLTLDYPNERIVLRSKIPDDGIPGEAILFDNADKTPLIPVRLGDREFAALIDSGSSAAIDDQPGRPFAPSSRSAPCDGPTDRHPDRGPADERGTPGGRRPTRIL